ncbi:MAG: hypothetical protein ABUT39_06865 [Acidobacteriota bacterium]
MHEQEPAYVVCIDNSAYPASLELRKIYTCLPDARAEGDGLVRVIDESGEDYLYPAKYFVPIRVPEAVERSFKAG